MGGVGEGGGGGGRICLFGPSGVRRYLDVQGGGGGRDGGGGGGGEDSVFK